MANIGKNPTAEDGFEWMTSLCAMLMAVSPVARSIYLLLLVDAEGAGAQVD